MEISTEVFNFNGRDHRRETISALKKEELSKLKHGGTKDYKKYLRVIEV